MRRLLLLIGLMSCSLATFADTTWVAGERYFTIDPAQPTNAPPGKVEVIEVFSYACPACNLFYPLIDKLKGSLPAGTQFTYLPASWHPEEDWKTFQRAYFAAQSLGLVAKTHAAVFDAIWKTGELATIDAATHRPKDQMPTIADVAKFYARISGTSADTFLEAAHSFGVDADMHKADAQIRAWQADQTPTLIINGKYRVTPRSAGSNDDLVKLVNWLVKQELAHH
jgi:thiol:disulfide interchange protein DsbA